MVKERKVSKININKKTEKTETGSVSAKEAIKASRKSADTDSPIDVFIYYPIAIRLTRLFIRAGWSANAVTFLSLIFGVGGSLFFYPQNPWINLFGIACALFALLLDYVDGQVARLTHTSSQFGRIFDGTVDIVNFLAIYIVLGMRMMNCETIPFTTIRWSYFVWIILFLTMLCHAGQARMADYYRGLHLYFLSGSNKANFTRTKTLRAELAALSKNSPLYEKVSYKLYLMYTNSQEKMSPCIQRLLDAIEDNGAIPNGLSDEFIFQSRRYIQLTNVLTYHIRACLLYILLLFGLHPFYMPCVIVIMEAVKYYMIAKYEAIAKNLYRKYYSSEADGR